jgi:radical SAM protein with 4Fe4S-binding SPASM domain
MRDDKNLSLSEFKRNLDFFKNCPLEIIKLEGISEPMLHPQFHLMAEEVKRYFPKSFLIVATNCQYRLEKTSLIQTIPFVDMLYLSIDGTEDIYEKARTGSRWETLLRFLDDLVEKIDKESRIKKIWINFTATKDNYLELPKLYLLVENLNLAGVRINLAQEWNEDKKNAHFFPEEMIHFLQSYRRDIKGVSPWKYDQCFWPHNGAVIDVFGNLRQCIINTSQTPLMNIHQASISEFYNNSEHYKLTRENLKNNTPGKECKNCDYALLSPLLEKIFDGERNPNHARKFTRF